MISMQRLPVIGRKTLVLNPFLSLSLFSTVTKQRPKKGNRSNFAGAVICLPGLEDLVHRRLVGTERSEDRLVGQQQRSEHPKEIEGLKKFKGVVEFNNHRLRDVYKIHQQSRGLGTRVLIRLALLKRVNSFSLLEDKLKAISIEDFVDKKRPVSIRVSCSRSKLWHSSAVEERVRNVFGLKNEVDGFDDESQKQLLVVQVNQNVVSISVSTTGLSNLTNSVNYREEVGKAPLNPCVANAMLDEVNYQPGDVVVDPMCGSGTILIEAALRSVRGGDKEEEFMRWKGFNAGAWGSVRHVGVTADAVDDDNNSPDDDDDDDDDDDNNSPDDDDDDDGDDDGDDGDDGDDDDDNTSPDDDDANLLNFPSKPAPMKKLLFGYDIDKKAINIAKRNAARAGVEHLIEFRTSPIGELTASKPIAANTMTDDKAAISTRGFFLLTNPPWGVRLRGKPPPPDESDADDRQISALRNLYAAIGNLRRTQFPKFTLGVLLAAKRLISDMHERGGGVRFSTIVGKREVFFFTDEEGKGKGKGKGEGKGKEGKVKVKTEKNGPENYKVHVAHREKKAKKKETPPME